MSNTPSRSYICVRCKKPIGRTVHYCKVCLKEFHPGCVDSTSHKIYDSDNHLVRCNGPYDIFDVQLSEVSESIEESASNRGNNTEHVSIDIGNTDVNIMTKLDNICNKIDRMPTVNANVIKEMIKTEVKEIIKIEVNNQYTRLEESIQHTIKLEINKITAELKNQFINNTQNSQTTTNKNINSYSEITKRISTTSNVERIVVKPIQVQDTNLTIDELKNNIDIVKLGVGVQKVTTQSKGKVLIDIEKGSDKTKLINEIQNSIDEIEVLINEMKPDILYFCETHVTSDVLDCEIDIKNYNMIRTNSNNSRTGGTITYVKENIKYKVVLNNNESEVLSTPKVSDHNIIFIEINHLDIVDNNKIVFSRSFKNFTDDMFQKEISVRFCNWKPELAVHDLNNNNNIEADILNYNLMVDKISNSVLEVFDSIAPFKEISSNCKWGNKPWIDKDIIKLIKERD
ncbi:Protein of unknown function, partial [Cotesia congregata]